MRRHHGINGLPVVGSLAALMAFALAGCVADGLNQAPDAAASKTSNALAARRIGGLDEWMVGFRSKELSRLIAGARRDNLDVAAAVARIEQAEAQASVATAALFPTIGGGLAATSTLVPGTSTSANAPFAATHQAFLSPGLTASYQVDFWGRNRDAVNSAQRLADANRYDKAVVEISTVSAVATTYFTMLSAQDRLRIVHENVATATEVLAAIKSRVAAGTASDGFESAQQESLLATQRAAAPPLEITVAQSRLALAVLLGQAPEGFSVRGGSLSELRVPRLSPGLPGTVLSRRPDVAEAQAKLVAQGFTVDEARAAMLPNITLTGQGGFESVVLKNLFSPHAIAYSVAAGLAQPLFDGGALKGKLDIEKGAYSELVAAAVKQTLTAITDVKKAMVASRLTAEQVSLSEASVAAAQRVLDASIERMKQGTIDVVSLSTTETALFQAKDALAQARLGRFLASVALYQSLGGGWSR